MSKMDTPAGRAARLETVIDRIAEEMNTMLRSARTTDEKILVLKAMGNAGLPECITPIKSIITSTSEPTPVKVKAIYALRRIAPIVKSEVIFRTSMTFGENLKCYPGFGQDDHLDEGNVNYRQIYFWNS